MTDAHSPAAPGVRPVSAWKSALWGLVLGMLAGALLGAAPARAELVRIGGTGAALGTFERLAEAYRQVDPDLQLQFVPSLGSSGGMKALASGAIGIGLISRAPKPAETAAGLQAIEYGRSAFVVVSSRPGLSQISLQQLADLYGASAPRWPDGSPVRLVLRPATDADTDLLAGFSPEMALALSAAMQREGLVTALTDQDAASTVERLPGSLGTATMALLLSERRQVRPLAIDGIEPSLENVLSGRYPYTKTLYLVVRPDASPGIRRFVDWVRSAAGGRLLAELGHVPSLAKTGHASAAR